MNNLQRILERAACKARRTPRRIARIFDAARAQKNRKARAGLCGCHRYERAALGLGFPEHTRYL